MQSWILDGASALSIAFVKCPHIVALMRFGTSMCMLACMPCVWRGHSTVNSALNQMCGGCPGALADLQATTLNSTAGLLSALQQLAVTNTTAQLSQLTASTVATTSSLLAQLQSLTINTTGAALSTLQTSAINNVTQQVGAHPCPQPGLHYTPPTANSY